MRIFNPFVLRGVFKKLGYVTEFSRNNRRMHNKSFLADGQTSIVGRCNVGNEYFGATDGMMLADLDVLVIGPVVRDIELLPSMGSAPLWVRSTLTHAPCT
ncbi:hypothetical protein ACLS0R_13655 [Comamonas jiangduensis]|uniref:hypothetical protein n=1 Tax=Comamonas jiangduensis TaxID=1194168 RepID=UPI003BF85A58